MPLAIGDMKECSKCRVIKPLNAFNKATRQADGLQEHCRECRSKYYYDNKEKILADVKRVSKQRYDWLIEYKNKSCYDCGKTYPPIIMDFDHVPEKGPKLFNITSGSYARKRVLEEIAKCDVVCPTCHRIRTMTRAGLLAKEDLPNVISQL